MVLDAARLASGARDNTVKIWNLAAAWRRGPTPLPCSLEHPYAGEEGNRKELENRLQQHKDYAKNLASNIKINRRKIEEIIKIKGEVSFRVQNGEETIDDLKSLIENQEKDIQRGLRDLQLTSFQSIAQKKEIFILFKQTVEGTYREYEQAASTYADLLTKHSGYVSKSLHELLSSGIWTIDSDVRMRQHFGIGELQKYDKDAYLCILENL